MSSSTPSPPKPWETAGGGGSGNLSNTGGNVTSNVMDASNNNANAGGLMNSANNMNSINAASPYSTTTTYGGVGGLPQTSYNTGYGLANSTMPYSSPYGATALPGGYGAYGGSRKLERFFFLSHSSFTSK